MYKDMESFYNDTGELIEILRSNNKNEYAAQFESALCGSTGGEIIGALHGLFIRYGESISEISGVKDLLHRQKVMAQKLYEQYYG